MEEFIIKQADGSVSYDVERFSSIQDAEIAEWKSGERSIERLEQILLKRLNPDNFVSGKGKSTWKKFINELFYSYSQIPDECCCVRLEKEIMQPDKTEASVSLASTGYGGTDLMARKNSDGTISYCFATYADGEDYSDGVMFCPFCGRKLKRKWK